MKTLPASYISTTISKSVQQVYDFISDPTNLPKWAEGLGESVVNENGAWIANSPMGKVKIKFADKNKFGVVDHDVTIESGKTFANPMRVIPNLDGCDVVFTLFRQPEMTNTQFAEDEDMITKDLAKLKSLLELATSTH